MGEEAIGHVIKQKNANEQVVENITDKASFLIQMYVLAWSAHTLRREGRGSLRAHKSEITEW